MHEALVSLLGPIAETVFAEWARTLPTETFYSVALFTEPGYGYVVDTVSTLEGLNRTANTYLDEEAYRQRWGDLPTAMRELKWSPCDSPYHAALADRFDPVNDALQTIWGEVDDDDASFDRTCETLQASFEHVIHAVSAMRRFPTSVVYNVLKGDQSDGERIHIARRLNSKALVSVYAAELRESGNL